MHSRASLLKEIIAYKSRYAEEKTFIQEFQTLLLHPHAFHRDHLPGHITGSAWIVDESFTYALLTHHAKLNRWLQPGGHADGDEDIVNVASREANEETGLRSLKILSKEIFDLDIHTIPARKDFPEHLHFDVRILFIASKSEPLVVTEESHALAWIPFQDLEKATGGNESILRMAEKVQLLRRNQK